MTAHLRENLAILGSAIAALAIGKFDERLLIASYEFTTARRRNFDSL